MKIFALSVFLILISCKDDVSTKINTEKKLAWYGIEYIDYQINEQVENDSIYIDLIGMDSMSNINWQNVNPTVIELFFPSSSVSNLEMDFNRFNRLEKLVISKSFIKDIPNSISELTNLKTLLIYGSKIEEIPIELCSMMSLKSLTIWRSKLTKLPSDIAKLKNLRHLNLIENKISKAEQQKISRLLPNCKVVFDY